MDKPESVVSGENLASEAELKELNRLKALERYDVHDEEFEEDFSNLLRVAGRLFKVPMAALSFVYRDTVTLQTMWGMVPRSSPRKGSFGEEVFKHKDIYILPDAQKEPIFAKNPYVAGAPYARFYAGVPLETFDGFRIGCLQIMDTEPRNLTEEEQLMLQTLGRQIMNRLDVSYRFYDFRKARAFYQSLVDNLPESLCIMRKDTDGKFTFGNRNFCHLVGKLSYEIVGKTDFDFFSPEMAKKYRLDDERVMASKEPFTADEVNEGADGSRHYVHVVKVPLFEPDNPYELIGIQCIFWDESQRVEAEQELLVHKNLLQRLLDMSADCIYFKDRDSRFIRVSDSMLHYFGLERQEDIVGKRDADFFLPERAEKTFRDEQKIMKTGIPIIGRVEHETWADGRVTHALTNKAPLRDTRGEVIGTFGISKDITKLIQTEETLKLARDKALDATRLKSEFLANMSHEIRTPMNAIIGMTEQLGLTKLDAQQKEFLSYISGSANALLSIINDILDFSKIEAGKFSIELTDCSLHQTIASTVYPLSRLADQKKIELLTHVDEDVPDWVCGAPERIRQVLINLIGNAIKFTAKGEVLLHVSVLKKTDAYCDVQFEVKDTGIGIEAAVIPKLFAAFSQADGSTTRKFGGTGLGLAISRQLTRLMKGDISVKSKPGKGSTFTFHIPFKPASRVHGAGECELYSSDWLRGKRILVVDDNATNREILRIYLEGVGAEVIESPGGDSALQILLGIGTERRIFDFALLDYQMPDMDGLTLAEKIRDNKSLASLPLILLTSVCSIQSSQVLSRSGIDRFLVKPIRKQKLFSCLRSILNHEPQPEILSLDGEMDSEHIERLPLEEISHRLQNQRILIAEDIPLNQQILLMQLGRLDCQADVVNDGFQAVEAVQKTNYDLIFMDCQMPNMDGYHATQVIRELEANRGGACKPAFIVAMTANALEGDKEKCIGAGMNGYLSKPVRQGDLITFLGKYAQQLTATMPQKSVVIPTDNTPAVLQSAPPVAKVRGIESIHFDAADFDMSTIENIRSLRRPGKPDPLQTAIIFFLEDAQRNESSLRDAIEANDLEKIRLHAHSLKGICMNLGAKKAGSLFLQVENQARSGKQVDYHLLVEPAIAELIRVKLFLETLSGAGQEP